LWRYLCYWQDVCVFTNRTLPTMRRSKSFSWVIISKQVYCVCIQQQQQCVEKLQ